ncbi:nuclear transcription factor Y subunit B-7-like [Tripterygium wilfordii]|uniref:Nuclear transcription factor Y subunit B-7-like n=1 Tax=Tripterygium wilfordii TaxID=458696 RepID=A0A7J7C295_TRIWF|nr:nuclear transcription factor Y subunit B-7 [Tripterygium wilfordii]KAF5727896.1 nuclear transcription factor Y subunit B-7-like [Tripterygium wilfordii]
MLLFPSISLHKTLNTTNIISSNPPKQPFLSSLTMEDHELPNRLSSVSPESPPLKNSNSSSSHSNYNHHHNNKEQDRFLPIANVGRIMKKMIPDKGKIAKDAKETVQECVSEFISFVTGEASDKCQREKRKTINGDDIIWAITTLGFEDYVGPLKLYLNKYREIEGEKLNIPKQHRTEQQRQQQQQEQQDQNMVYSNVYSTTNLMSQPPFDQTFSLPFSPNSIQKQLQQPDQIDSVGHW